MDQIRRCDVHVICCLLKRFLEQLPEPLFTMPVFETIRQPGFQSRLEREGLEGMKGALMSLVEQAPEHNFWTIQYVFGHLQRVLSFATANLSTPQTLAVSLAHVLLAPSRAWGKVSDDDEDLQVEVIEALLASCGSAKKWSGVMTPMMFEQDESLWAGHPAHQPLYEKTDCTDRSSVSSTSTVDGDRDGARYCTPTLIDPKQQNPGTIVEQELHEENMPLLDEGTDRSSSVEELNGTVVTGLGSAVPVLSLEHLERVARAEDRLQLPAGHVVLDSDC